MNGYALTVGDNVVRNTGNTTPDNITAETRGWRDTVQDIGGFWDASGSYWLGDKDEFVDKNAALQFFTTRLGAHIKRTQNSVVRWEGRVSTIKLTLDGVAYQRSLDDIVNRCKITYQRYSQSGLYDGSAEISTIAGVGGITNRAQATLSSGTVSFRNERHTPYESFNDHPSYDFPIIALSSVWTTNGTYAVYVDTDPCWKDDETWGGGVRYFSSLPSTADGLYYLTADVYVPPGEPARSVTLYVYDTSGTQFSMTMGTGAGTYQVKTRFQANSSATGNFQILIICDDYMFHYYIDNVSLKEVGVRTSTGWLDDLVSQAEYGVYEYDITAGGMTDAEANAHRQQIISNMAWPRTMAEAISESANGLTFECEGYAATLSNKSTSVGGVKTCAQHIADLLATSQFVTLAYSDANTMLKYVDAENPTRQWDAIQEVVDAGGTSGARFIGGVYANRKFWYAARPTVAAYVRKGKSFLYPDKTEADPQTMSPGIVFLEDLPTSQNVYASTEDDPRYCYISKWEYTADDNVARPIETRRVLEIE